MDFGSTIRAARESHGLTTNQVAAQTRIVVQIIEEMERNDFSQIAAPIYGRGFVKLICECLDLDPTATVALFMAEYNHPHVIEKPRPNKQPAFSFARHTEHPVSPPDATATPVAETTQEAVESEIPPQEEPPPQGAFFEEPIVDEDEVEVKNDYESVMPPPAAEPIAAESNDTPLTVESSPETPASVPKPEPVPPKVTIDSTLKGLELFDPLAGSATTFPQQPATPAAEPPSLAGFRQQAAQAPADDFSRFATPLPPQSVSGPSPIDRFRANLAAVSSNMLIRVRERHRSYLRISLLVVTLAAVVGLIVWGIIALFRATSRTPPPTPESTPTQEVQEVQEQKEPASQAVKNDNQETAAPAPSKATVPLKLQGFYID